MRSTITGVGGSLTALATPFRDMRVDWNASRACPNGRSSVAAPR